MQEIDGLLVLPMIIFGKIGVPEIKRIHDGMVRQGAATGYGDMPERWVAGQVNNYGAVGGCTIYCTARNDAIFRCELIMQKLSEYNEGGFYSGFSGWNPLTHNGFIWFMEIVRKTTFLLVCDGVIPCNSGGPSVVKRSDIFGAMAGTWTGVYKPLSEDDIGLIAYLLQRFPKEPSDCNNDRRIPSPLTQQWIDTISSATQDWKKLKEEQKRKAKQAKIDAALAKAQQEQAAKIASQQTLLAQQRAAAAAAAAAKAKQAAGQGQSSQIAGGLAGGAGTTGTNPPATQTGATTGTGGKVSVGLIVMLGLAAILLIRR